MPDFPAVLHERLAGRSAEDQKFLLVAALNEAMPPGASATLVGGSLVQLYTMGAIMSLDVDLVADRRIVQRLLEEAGFEENPISMWRHPDHAVVVNIVGDEIGASERAGHVDFEGHEIPVVSPEDCIVDRLCGALHWKDTSDRERAILLLRVLGDDLDERRLRARAREERVEALLDEAWALARG